MEEKIPDFSNLLGGESTSSTDVLAQLLSPENIFMKTKIQSRQGRAIFKILWISELQKAENEEKSGIDILIIVLNRYLELVVSIDGERSKAIMETLKELKPSIEERPLIEGMKK